MKRDLVPPTARIERIAWARFDAVRPRSAGANARLGTHGQVTPVDLVRISAGGVDAFGFSRIGRDQADRLIGQALVDLFDDALRVRPDFRRLEFPLLDWLGRVAARPVYSFFAPGAAPGHGDAAPPVSVPCYDTTLYIDDLDVTDDDAAVARMQEEALAGWQAGHRAFKIKVGRGAMHMPLLEGLRRDIAVVNGVRAALGPGATLLIDANNGYNLNLAKQALAETEDAGLFWIEEAFHEDPAYYQDLKAWLRKRGLTTLIADGEGHASPRLLEYAENGLVDVIQYDLRGYGFCAWLELGRRLDAAGICAAPHNYGGLYGNFAQVHVAPAIERFLFAEWDEAATPVIDTGTYKIVDGRVLVPDRPGFGLELDAAGFERQVRASGWSCGAPSLSTN